MNEELIRAFVDARITDDEQTARNASRYVDDPPFATMDTVAACDCDEDHAYASYLAMSPGRVLAECAAKRLLLSCLGPPYFAAGGSGAPYEYALRALAMPYAAHPDYDDAWGLERPYWAAT